jgi:hypothetical protein
MPFAKPYIIDMITAPNPAETHVGLRFGLPADAHISVEIIDALQRMVLKPLNNELRLKGDHEIAIGVGHLPSGAYSIRVNATLTNGKTLIQNRQLLIVR